MFPVVVQVLEGKTSKLGKNDRPVAIGMADLIEEVMQAIGDTLIRFALRASDSITGLSTVIHLTTEDHFDIKTA